jgi:hypothetical protein
MALVLTFPCGRCGKRYSVYYPKALLYELSGTGTREKGEREDEEERRSGAIEAARNRAVAAGNVWVNAAEHQVFTCTCGKTLDLNILHHPRIPQSRPSPGRKETGLIPFPEPPDKSP